jgi:glucose-1-phosphate cytidylyltransferase
LGYKGDYIKQYFLNQRELIHNFTLHTRSGFTKVHKKDGVITDHFKVTFVDTGENTLPGERILRVQNYIPKEDEDFMVTYGDGVADINIKELVRFHKKQKTMGTITGVHPRSKYGLLKINDQSKAENFIEKPILKERTNGGFMIFKRKALKYFNPGEFEHEALKRMVKENQLSVFLHDGFWHCMDTYNDVESLNQIWKEDPKWKVWK